MSDSAAIIVVFVVIAVLVLVIPCVILLCFFGATCFGAKFLTDAYNNHQQHNNNRQDVNVIATPVNSFDDPNSKVNV